MGSIFCIGQSAYDITIPLDGAICENQKYRVTQKEEYYSRLFAFNDGNIDKSTITSLMGENLKFDEIPFRTYAENFKFIKNQVIGIVIPRDENKDLIEQLRYGKLSVKRKLQQYSASVHIWELEEMIKEGIIEQLDCGVCILANTDYYKSDVGLTLENDVDYFV